MGRILSLSHLENPQDSFLLKVCKSTIKVHADSGTKTLSKFQTLAIETVMDMQAVVHLQKGGGPLKKESLISHGDTQEISNTVTLKVGESIHVR